MTADKLISTVEIIKSKTVEQFDETAIKQTVILQLLADLGWNIFDRDEVFPEYTIEGKRVDYSLRNNNTNKVFIEAKKPEENLEKHQEQLLNYSFKEGVQLAILTNGVTWWFYLPLQKGAWTNRKFYTIDFKSQNEGEISEKLIQFLSKENILSDKSIRIAEETLKSKNRQGEIENSLPVVWKNLLNKPTPEFIRLLADETEKHCGFRPTDDFVVTFLNADKAIQDTEEDEEPADNFTTTLPIENNVRASNTRLKVTLPNGRIINEYKAIDTFIKTIQEFGIDKVKRLQVRNGAPLISDKAYNVGIKKKYKQISNTSLYIDINHSTQLKKDYLERIAKLLDTKITVQIEDKK
ncbi:MAG: type I restriction enzyme HsdR N-terminal domain-containing protein [Nitrospinae bacterium]|nr:type I restriction enzyme HsdR N-terminal domain-containing protein [Nitrospinota bacterium]